MDLMEMMQERDPTHEQLLAEIAQLRARLAEPEETIAAIRAGAVDAFVVQEAHGEAIHTLAATPLLRQLSLITDSLPVLVAYVDREGRYQFNNRQYETWFCRPLHEILGLTLPELLGGEAFAVLRPHVEAALAGQRAEFTSRLIYSGIEPRWVHATYVPHVHHGEVQGFVSFVEDVTESKQAEQALQLLADAGKLLSESLDLAATLDAAARLAVPVLADSSTLDLVEDIEDIEDIEDVDRGADSLAARVLLAGRPVLVRELPEEVPTPPGAEALPPALAAAGVRSALGVPLIAHGRTLGVWTFFHAASGRLHHEHDLRVARELAGRVAAALDNARLYREVEAANRAKDHFLAALSHELRTPLAPALAMVERLEAGGGLPAGVRGGLGLIRRNIELEARLIDDLLDITRISHGKLELRLRQLDLRQTVHQALETCGGPVLAARRVTVDLAAADHRVTGDPARLAQVFWNLLSNALKFTPAGGEVAVRSHVEDGPPPPAAGAGAPAPPDREGYGNHGGRWLVVEIADSGAGIEPEDMPRIFDAFAQGQTAGTRSPGGLGLGLAISRTIVELHGGSLEAVSAGHERGAVFTVRLPLAGAGTAAAPADGDGSPIEAVEAIEEAAAGRRHAAGGAPDGAADGAADGATDGAAAASGLRILLIDDHLDTAAAMAELLAAMGHRVQVAGSVAESVAAAAVQPFDLVISDLGLPDGHGTDLMRHLAGRHGLPGIAISGYGMEDDIVRSRAAGFALHLTKPVSIESLSAAIRRVAGGGGAAGSARE